MIWTVIIQVLMVLWAYSPELDWLVAVARDSGSALVTWAGR
jgi:hypothetical protein